ncbi:MAG TPA: class I tRNA ligase family protein, partial [Bacillota bacterium]|nr:class I tRNA ligase family protein [Bacillota bacterium]
PIVEVISAGGVDVNEAPYCSTEEGTLVNSGFLDGMGVAEAIAAMTRFLSEKGIGKEKVNYKLRDWVFSRQRYWGEPIPMVECQHCGWVPVPYEQLPLKLPEVQKYQTTDTGESPLAQIKDWVRTKCPKCGGDAERETDTMPNWAGSSWYFLRYTDPRNKEAIASKEALKYWTPVDWYNGGMEHTTLHLLYSRFWHKFLFDIGVVPTPEPYSKRTSHGLVLGEDNEKMSKSRGNVINPDEMVDKYGADAFRLFELFMGAFDQPIPWSTQGLIGMQRFLYRVWDLQGKVRRCDGADTLEAERMVHQTIRKVSADIEDMKYNTALAQLMSLANWFGKRESIKPEHWDDFLKLLSPFAPHIAEEMYEARGHKGGLAKAPWPVFDPEKAREDEVEVPVQVNGKLKDVIKVPAGSGQEELLEAAMASEKVAAAVAGKPVRKTIVIPGKMVNIVV